MDKSTYKAMDWVDALAARKKPRDPSVDLISIPEGEIIDNTLESTASVAFGLSPKAENKHEALVRASKAICSERDEEIRMGPANEIRKKLATAEIDPVALGIEVRTPNGGVRKITQEEWLGSADPRWVEKIATAAALEQEKRIRMGWEQNGFKGSSRMHSIFDSKESRDGMIMPLSSTHDETAIRHDRVAANQNSMFETDRLDKFAKDENIHDISVAAIKTDAKKREAERKAELVPKDLGPNPMKGGQVIKSGGEDRDVFVQKAPRNQISMLDDIGSEGLTPAQLKDKLANLFVAKLEDSRTKIREGNAERLANIQDTKRVSKDRSWETLSKPASTSDLATRLMNAWLPEAPQK